MGTSTIPRVISASFLQLLQAGALVEALVGWVGGEKNFFPTQRPARSRATGRAGGRDATTGALAVIGPGNRLVFEYGLKLTTTVVTIVNNFSSSQN